MPRGFQEVKVPRLRDNGTGWWYGCQPYAPAAFYPPGNTRFVQKVSGLITLHEVDKAYGVLTPIVFNIVPFRSYTLRPTFLPLLETFWELLFRDV